MTTTFLMRIQLLYSCTELYSSKITEDVRDSPKVFIALEICLAGSTSYKLGVQL